MLYYLFRFLEKFNIPGSGMWEYISFRSLFAFISALLISLYFGKKFINWMNNNRNKVEEKKFDENVDSVAAKRDFVPSMGGIVIIFSILIPVIFIGRLRNIYLLLMICTTIWLGLTGFADDYLKIKKDKNGLKPRWKLFSQLGLGLFVGLTLYLSPDAVIVENTIDNNSSNQEVSFNKQPSKSTVTTIPFVKSHNMDYSKWAFWTDKYKQPFGWFIFVLVTIFFIMFASNGANLNDGMDGMAAGNSAIIYSTLAVLAYVSSHTVFASYLNIMFIPGSQELVVFISAMIGALIGFLWYNTEPAQMFMGDTGSLTIGGTIGVIAVIIHKELLLFILCGIFLVELASSKLQTIYSRFGNKKGKKQRLFKRAPIHDAFRSKYNFLEGVDYKLGNKLSSNLADSKVTVRFWIISILLAALTIITLKVR